MGEAGDRVVKTGVLDAPVACGFLALRHRARTWAPLALLAIALLLAVPAALAFESHTINVRMTLGSPVVLSEESFMLAAGDADRATFTVELAPAFAAQERLDGLEYRLVATVEPADSVAARVAQPPTIVFTRSPAERDVAADAADRAYLTADPPDAGDRWAVALEPAPDRTRSAPPGVPEPGAPAAPSAEPTSAPSADATASVGATGTPPTTPGAPTVPDSPGAGPMPSSGSGLWLVRVRVEVIVYRPAAGEVE